MRSISGGAGGTRTLDFLNAIEALSQLSYSPTKTENPNLSDYTGGRARAQERCIVFRVDARRIPRNSLTLLPIYPAYAGLPLVPPSVLVYATSSFLFEGVG